MRVALCTTLLALAACSGGEPDGPKDKDPDCVGEECIDDPTDADGDGYDALDAGGDDCDDDDADIHPDADEVPYDGIDQDCAGGDLTDVDGDGYDGVEAAGDDCNDGEAYVYPGAEDTVGDSVDQSCDGIDGTDADGDGHASTSSGGLDCDDGDAARNPDATEIWYDGVDQDCDRLCDYDQDGDGAVEPGSPVQDNSVCDLDPFPGAVDAPEDCDDTNPDASTVAVTLTDPVANELDVSPTLPVVVTLSEADAAATLTVLDPSGATVPGATLPSGLQLVFTPDSPFDWATTFTVEATHGCGTVTFDFTTRAAPTPVDPTSLVDRVWEVDAAAGNWVEPPGVGSLVSALIELPLLLSVTSEATTTLDMRAGIGPGGVQDVCSPTTEIAGVDLTANPVLGFGPVDVSSSFAGVTATISDTYASGQFSPDGSAIQDLILDGNVDTRPMVDLIVPGGPPDTVCALVATFGVPCTPCPDGTGTYCLDVRVEDLTATEVVGGSLVQRTDADIAADPYCP